MKKITEKFLNFLNLVKMYFACLFVSVFFIGIIMLFIIAMLESENKETVFYLNYSNPEFKILSIIATILSIILSIALYVGILTKLEKKTEK